MENIRRYISIFFISKKLIKGFDYFNLKFSLIFLNLVISFLIYLCSMC